MFSLTSDATPMRTSPWPAGQFCWAELATISLPDAASFYAQLFGWSPDTGQDETYTIFKRAGYDLLAAYDRSTDKLAKNAPPTWFLYVASNDVDATVSAAEEAGGHILAGPAEVGNSGRVAVLRDPIGATIGVYQATGHFGTATANEPGSMCWWELAARDAARVAPFYEHVFGWTAQVGTAHGTAYTRFVKDEVEVAGMLQMTAEWGDIPSNWSLYFQVADIDA
ncbi:MAG: VOC family protein, partial [Bacteroidota bacterium]